MQTNIQNIKKNKKTKHKAVNKRHLKLGKKNLEVNQTIKCAKMRTLCQVPEGHRLEG